MNKWQEWSNIANEPARWQNHEEKGLLKAEHIENYVLNLWFEESLDVTIYALDFYPLFIEENPGGVFLALKDKERFRSAKGDFALVWPNPETGAYDEQAIDLAPECVRFFCEKYGKKLKSPEKAIPA